MKKENVLQEKTFAFAVRVVNAYKYLCDEKNEKVLSRQFLRSGTSIGANVEEAIGAQTKRDFYFKLHIVYKEARETSYWIRLMEHTEYIDTRNAKSLLDDCEEILKITGSILKTMKNSIT